MARPAEDLAQFGIFNIDGLKKKIEDTKQTPYLVDGLIAEHSLNLLAGHSALGKTPLAITLGSLRHEEQWIVCRSFSKGTASTRTDRGRPRRLSEDAGVGRSGSPAVSCLRFNDLTTPT